MWPFSKRTGSTISSDLLEKISTPDTDVIHRTNCPECGILLILFLTRSDSHRESEQKTECLNCGKGKSVWVKVPAGHIFRGASVDLKDVLRKAEWNPKK